MLKFFCWSKLADCSLKSFFPKESVLKEDLLRAAYKTRSSKHKLHFFNFFL